jgi:hypothetical protein
MAIVETTNALPLASLPSSPVNVKWDVHVVSTPMSICAGGLSNRKIAESVLAHRFGDFRFFHHYRWYQNNNFEMRHLK